MGRNVSRSKRPRKAPPPPSPHIREWCPICVKPVGQVIAGLYRCGQGSRRLTMWACEECAKRFAVPADPKTGGYVL